MAKSSLGNFLFLAWEVALRKSKWLWTVASIRYWAEWEKREMPACIGSRAKFRRLRSCGVRAPEVVRRIPAPDVDLLELAPSHAERGGG